MTKRLLLSPAMGLGATDTIVARHRGNRAARWRARGSVNGTGCGRRWDSWRAFRSGASIAAATAVVIGLVSVLGAGASGAGASAANANSVRLGGNVVPVVAQGGLQSAPAHASDALQRQTLTITLKRDDQSGFTSYLHAVQDPSSSHYHHFLTGSEIAKTFGPTQSTYDAVLSWVSSDGLTLVHGSPNRLTLTVAGTRAQVAQTFDTPIQNFRLGGRTVYANTANPAVPAQLAGDIEAVSGLSDTGLPVGAPEPASTATPQPTAGDATFDHDLAAFAAGHATAAQRADVDSTLATLAKGRLSADQDTALGQDLAALVKGKATAVQRASVEQLVPQLSDGQTTGASGASLVGDVDTALNGQASPSQRAALGHDVTESLGTIAAPQPSSAGWYGFVACAPQFLSDLKSADPEVGLAILLLLLLAPELYLVWLGLFAVVSNGPAAILYGICVGKYASSHGGFGLGPALGGHVKTAQPHITNPQKIGLLEFDTFHPSDVSNWLALFGGNPSLASSVSEVNVDGGVPTPGAGEDEVLLDIDTVLELQTTPGATQVVVYDAPATTSFADMFQTMASDGDTVISNSWSQCEDETTQSDADAIDSVLQSAALQGITVFNGTGDDGSSCLDGSSNTIGVPADSPNATAVGGTTPTFGDDMNVTSETWWDDPGVTGQGGFGVSQYFPRPSYQNGLTTSAQRSVPDVAVEADPHDGIEFCQADDGGCPDGHLQGGTSMAAPEMAALTANMNEQLGTNIGNFNDAVYPVESDPDVFTSATQMSSDFQHVGLGSPNWNYLELALAHLTIGPVDATTSFVGATESLADGSTPGLVRVQLLDSNDSPVANKQVSIGSTSGTTQISPSNAITDTQGDATFTVTDTVAETVTITAHDDTDSLTLSTTPTLAFETPPASGAEIFGGPAQVTNDGTSQATITVYLQDQLGQPAPGKTVSLGEGDGSATITPQGSSTPGNTAVTDSAGDAVFTATDTDDETVTFSALDVTDANVPVPGSVAVNFTSQMATCSTSLPTPSSGTGVSTFASGFPYSTQDEVFPGNFTLPGCTQEEFAPAFDKNGNAYVSDELNGTIYVLPSTGGTASQANQLPDTTLPAGSLGQLAFGPDGALYASLIQTDGTVTQPEIVQLDPTTGATERVIASSATGLPDCPSVLVVDPLSGDLFTDDQCSGFAASSQISRISDPSGASPTVSDYIITTSTCNLGMAFAPDGTLYLANCLGELDSITGTNTPTPVESTVASVSGYPFAVAITGTNSSGAATAATVFSNDGHVTAVDLTQDPATTSTIADGPSGFYLSATNSDGCAFGTIPGTIVRVGPPSCGSAQTTSPALALTGPANDAPPAGSPASFTATLNNVASPAGTPILFQVAGANTQQKLIDAGSGGSATFTYNAVHPGRDTVIATATAGADDLTSNPIAVTWTLGKDTSAVMLNGSQGIGQVGHPATISAYVADISQDPATAVDGATVEVTVGSQACTLTTNAAGIGTCQVSPATAGLLPVTGTFAGNNSLTASSATASLLASSSAPPAPPAPPPPPPPSNSSPGPAQGYRLVATDGGVFDFGDASYLGSLASIRLNAPIVGLAPTSDGKGYWLVGSDGGVFTFGDATYFGSLGGSHLNAPIVAVAPTPDDKGYWLVASDGGVFSFGDAAFFGSEGGRVLHKPIVGLAPTPSGKGYWMVASDGGVFSFGDAAFLGSEGGTPLNQPIVGLAPTPSGKGYWMVAADGGIFSFGDAMFFGSEGGKPLNRPIVGLAPTPLGKGYWLVASDGGVFTFGDANFLGSEGGKPLNKPVLGIEPEPSSPQG